ncbi:MAG: peptidase [Clostridium tyrobutyricum]|jgi:hypothetical protein|uniref:peptidase n=1 Tax=Clostridium tyrobutyricum TaxID=1519 RepID=UPI002430677D|nr:peptidase [Clostridium tyrobutyricum]MCH4201201.1 peptidase [Clostridium tyrobutyricum]MCH4237765.1 peptidase [Clostridium tyrobutyricum]MCH4259418.1 peptidase [Clostridium tyrobutyricum]MCI1653691.1 peptidase [Clostridium tyrobutyricum]MCI1937827.1 peptidase [Clostridium tyrobutyricum]
MEIKGEKMEKLILKSTNLYSLKDSENIDLGELCFDQKQFKIPQAMLIQNDGFSARIERTKNSVGELVETGKMTLFFKVYDRPFIELLIHNGSSEIGSPITISVKGQDELPSLGNYEDGEFIPISFSGLRVMPKKVQKKSFVGQGKPMLDIWQYSELKIEADRYSIGEKNEPKTK